MAPVETHSIPSPFGLLSVLHQAPPTVGGREPPVVLYVHGATFPAALSVAWQQDNESWMGALVRKGLDAWAFDFAGFGRSERFPAMHRNAPSGPPLGRLPEALSQVEAVIAFLREKRGGARVSLLAHSWGTMVGGAYAAQHPEAIERLVLFGPIAQREEDGAPPPVPAFLDISLAYQWERFQADVPTGQHPVLSRAAFAAWGAAYLATDPTNETRKSSSVRIPAGPMADIAQAHHGRFPYDPSLIRCDVLIVRGEWDTLSTDQDAAWLWRRLSHARHTSDLKLSRGTHVMHLEAGRHRLFRAVAAFVRQESLEGEGL